MQVGLLHTFAQHDELHTRAAVASIPPLEKLIPRLPSIRLDVLPQRLPVSSPELDSPYKPFQQISIV
jgi:hypothetical protein